MNILYAGDSPPGGPANYLLGILRYLNARILHIPPSDRISSCLFKKSFDGIILSDFSYRKLKRPAEKEMVSQIKDGCGLLMVGGWGSFSGPFGGWRGSLIEEVLPVNCLAGDDRENCPTGALIFQKKQHVIFRNFSFENPPVICGFNCLQPKKDSIVVLETRRILVKPSYQPSLERRGAPLLIVDPCERRAALATDLAPHWCGGLVDWGKRRLKLPVKSGICVEVGERYVEFVSLIIRWLAGR